jgi:hypothetical protein
MHSIGTLGKSLWPMFIFQEHSCFNSMWFFFNNVRLFPALCLWDVSLKFVYYCTTSANSSVLHWRKKRPFLCSSPSSLEWKKVDKISIENRLLCPLLSSKIILFSSLLHEIFNCFDLSLISYLLIYDELFLVSVHYVLCSFVCFDI